MDIVVVIVGAILGILFVYIFLDTLRKVLRRFLGINNKKD